MTAPIQIIRHAAGSFAARGFCNMAYMKNRPNVLTIASHQSGREAVLDFFSVAAVSAWRA